MKLQTELAILISLGLLSTIEAVNLQNNKNQYQLIKSKHDDLDIFLAQTSSSAAIDTSAYASIN